MTCGAVILAAHGSDRDDRVNAQVFALADRVEATGRFATVVPALFRGRPHYSTVLDELNRSPVIVVPYMTSNGYYCSEVLPRELARNQCFAETRVCITSPVGVHPKMTSMAKRRVVALAAEYGIALERASILVVGHGTRRHPQSRDATISLARSLSRRLDVIESLPCFLDDQPGIRDAHAAAAGQDIIAIVFLLTDGVHARRDVLAELSLVISEHHGPPYTGCVGGRRIVCDAPIGMIPGVTRLIVDIASETSTVESTHEHP